MYDVKIRALTAVNGVVTLQTDATVYSYNRNFLEALLGFSESAQTVKIKVSFSSA